MKSSLKRIEEAERKIVDIKTVQILNQHVESFEKKSLLHSPSPIPNSLIAKTKQLAHAAGSQDCGIPIEGSAAFLDFARLVLVACGGEGDEGEDESDEESE